MSTGTVTCGAWMERILTCRLRKASMMPLTPSPGIPNTVSTPQANRVSTRTSLAVVFMGRLLECEDAGRLSAGSLFLTRPFQRRSARRGLRLRREAGAGGVIGSAQPVEQQQPQEPGAGEDPLQRGPAAQAHEPDEHNRRLRRGDAE